MNTQIINTETNDFDSDFSEVNRIINNTCKCFAIWLLLASSCFIASFLLANNITNQPQLDLLILTTLSTSIALHLLAVLSVAYLSSIKRIILSWNKTFIYSIAAFLTTTFISSALVICFNVFTVNRVL
jgi:hypothetical protein